MNQQMGSPQIWQPMESSQHQKATETEDYEPHHSGFRDVAR